MLTAATRALRLGGLALAWLPALAGAQSPQQVEYLRRNPQVVREQLLRSGMSAQQIRQRLESSGYSGSLLDQFLEPGAGPLQPGLTETQLGGLRALGITEIRAQGLEPIPLDTGFVSLRPAAPEEDRGLRLYGLDVFRGTTTLFQPVLSGPVPPSYRVGAGDVMVLVITGDVEFVHELTVTREGFVVIPQVGQLFVSNLTMEQLSQLLRQRLGRAYSGIRTGTTRFDVTITRLRTIQVFVIGEVAQPGAYQLASVATVLNALYAAGGPTERGNFREIVVRRQGQPVTTLDLYDYLQRGSTDQDVILEQGDVVFVPLRGTRATVTGAVVRPAVYELKPGETLEALLATAGGFRPSAELRRVAIHRILPVEDRHPGPAPRAVVDVALRANGATPQNDGARDLLRGIMVPDVVLVDGDSVVVDSITSPGASLTVAVVGMVRRPGSYPWREGMTLRELVTLARGPTVGADLRQAEVAHLPADRTGGQLAETVRVPLDSSYLFERDSAGTYIGAPGLPFPSAGSAPDVVLRPYDRVTIFRQPEFELHRTVSITGEVQYPGNYTLERKDERVSDLVRRAGGLLPTAYADGARFIRRLDAAGRINIRLTEALAGGGTRSDIVLQPGDSLDIPEYIPTVRVEGAVNSPTSVLYEEGAGLDYYIANAGGYARNADRGRVHVRYSNGSARVKSRFVFFSSSPSPGPGSVVTVPLVRAEDKTDIRGLVADITQILATLGTLAIVALRP